MKLHRVALPLVASTVAVVAVAALLPRGYIANDDIGLTEYLRKDVFVSWMSPILARALGLAYRAARDVPWYGLYLYALIIATGAAAIHTCTEVISRRDGLGRIVTLLGAVAISATPAILAIGLTWTAVSIYALGTAAVAFIAHAQLCHADGRPMSRLRSLALGLLFACGYMLRREGLAAAVIAILPVLGWAALRFARVRHAPRLGAAIAFLAPFAVVIAIQHRIPQARGSEFETYNLERGQIHGQTAYEQLDRRAPEVLDGAGWTVQQYRDFTAWRIIDERDYPLEKLERLVDTGGVPENVDLGWGGQQLRAIFDESAVSILLFVTLAITGLALASLGVIERWRGLGFSLGYLVFLTAVTLWMAAHYRFPQRVALAFYIVAAVGMFAYLAREIADRPAVRDLRPLRDHRAALALLVLALLLASWARHLKSWLERSPSPYRDALQALEDRVAARNGFVFVFVQAGLVELDPLRAEPRSYDALQGGWGTFSAAWYETIARLGVHRGVDVFAAMIDNPEAYLLAQSPTREVVEDWIRRKVDNPSVRLAFVDGAAIPGGDRPVLYRVVTTPPTRGDAEWRALERDEWAMSAAFPGPPRVDGLAFREVAFAAPYEQHLSQPRNPAARLAVSPVSGGLRSTATGVGDDCTGSGDDGYDAGVHIPVNGLRAVRFAVTLIDPANIMSLHALARTRAGRAIRWSWELSPQAQEFGFTGSFTLVPGYSAHRLQVTVHTARLTDIRDLDIFVTIKPGTRAGLEVRDVAVAEP